MCCQVFRCCGWIIDILQRILTLIMSCIICCALICGCMIALSAGIAYGYNASIMEYLDVKKSDITVYVRRGQFGDQAVSGKSARRAGGDEPDVFASNYSVDYQEHKIADNSRSLSEAWQKAQDTSNYADKLTKYSKMKSVMRTFSKDEDVAFGNLPVEEPSFNNNIPPSERVDLLTMDNTSSSSDGLIRKVPEYHQFYPQSDHSNQETNKESMQETRKPTRRKNRKKHKHKEKKPKILEIDNSKSVYLQPNASKFLYRQEDFEDEDVEIRNKPV